MRFSKSRWTSDWDCPVPLPLPLETVSRLLRNRQTLGLTSEEAALAPTVLSPPVPPELLPAGPPGWDVSCSLLLCGRLPKTPAAHTHGSIPRPGACSAGQRGHPASQVTLPPRSLTLPPGSLRASRGGTLPSLAHSCRRASDTFESLPASRSSCCCVETAFALSSPLGLIPSRLLVCLGEGASQGLVSPGPQTLKPPA